MSAGLGQVLPSWLCHLIQPACCHRCGSEPFIYQPFCNIDGSVAVLGKQWLLHYHSVGERGTIKERGLELAFPDSPFQTSLTTLLGLAITIPIPHAEIPSTFTECLQVPWTRQLLGARRLYPELVEAAAALTPSLQNLDLRQPLKRLSDTFNQCLDHRGNRRNRHVVLEGRHNRCNPSEEHLDTILNFLRPDENSLEDLSLLADFLFCLSSFFVPPDAHDLSVMDKSEHYALLITLLFENLANRLVDTNHLTPMSQMQHYFDNEELRALLHQNSTWTSLAVVIVQAQMMHPPEYTHPMAAQYIALGDKISQRPDWNPMISGRASEGEPRRNFCAVLSRLWSPDEVESDQFGEEKALVMSFTLLANAWDRFDFSNSQAIQPTIRLIECTVLTEFCARLIDDNYNTISSPSPRFKAIIMPRLGDAVGQAGQTLNTVSTPKLKWSVDLALSHCVAGTPAQVMKINLACQK
ncbi:hypothetical protein DFH08DRAFT_817602 [Mycena albidolilacea]|uniref:Uncharacterized protein n=1 Tax=Mycena albidolilacea TaxID=1033008 RepID=A0AAD7EGQ5_9AGAR|nr:hypothetical protein DFH08DRAFT_817602 [Mycena albidolilacea]